MSLVKKGLLLGSAVVVGVPLITLILVYSLNSNMSGSKAVELYENAENVCENPYETAAYAERLGDYNDQFQSLEMRAKRDDQFEFAARMRRTIQFAELQIAAMVCEQAVMNYFVEVTLSQANDFERHWSWRARFHADCARIAQDWGAERFGKIRAPLARARMEETFPDFSSVERSVQNEIASQPWQMRAHVRMCQ